VSSIAFMLAGVPRAACVLILSIETELTTTAEQSGSIVFDTLYSARRRICFGGGAEKFSGGGIENSAAAPKISTGGGGGIRRRRALTETYELHLATNTAAGSEFNSDRLIVLSPQQTVGVAVK
jgi:hypothetical protein